MMSGLRIAALFAAYSAVGFGGEYAVGLLGQEADVDQRYFTVDVEPVVDVAVHVDVDHEVVVDVQMRSSDACSFEADQSLSLAASLSEALAINVGSGDLRIEGVAGLDEVRAVGRLCASDEELFDNLGLTLEETRQGIILSAHYPEQRNWRGNRKASIDLTVQVPLGMVTDVDDSSGDMTITGTGDLRIDDSSGNIDVSAIEGFVRIDDSSGGIEVRDVMGDVSIEDGSGGIDVDDVRGSVLLDDGSGGIRVSEVGLDVVVEDDGSGSIRVENVGGDFRVDDDGSGSISHSGVEGEVSIPQDKKRKRRRG